MPLWLTENGGEIPAERRRSIIPDHPRILMIMLMMMCQNCHDVDHFRAVHDAQITSHQWI
jgi:hypothetical protein